MKLKALKLRDKAIFDKYLGLKSRELSAYSFTNIYIWKKLFAISWQVLDGSLCVFFQDRVGCFLYLEPLAGEVSAYAVADAFRVMDSFNRNKEISRIENIEESRAGFYRSLGYTVEDKFGEYLCRRSGLAGLSGNKFKSKRACSNYFAKNYAFEYKPFTPRCAKGCLRLYDAWAESRAAQKKDSLYQGMLKDSRAVLEVLLAGYSKLGVVGRVVIASGEVKAFSFGFALNRETFCVLFEVTDLKLKGSAQYIFRRFCAEVGQYKYINIMDDSGLENLKKVKLSYRPERIIPSFICVRKNA